MKKNAFKHVIPDPQTRRRRANGSVGALAVGHGRNSVETPFRHHPPREHRRSPARRALPTLLSKRARTPREPFHPLKGNLDALRPLERFSVSWLFVPWRLNAPAVPCVMIHVDQQPGLRPAWEPWPTSVPSSEIAPHSQRGQESVLTSTACPASPVECLVLSYKTRLIRGAAERSHTRPSCPTQWAGRRWHTMSAEDKERPSPK